MKRQTNELSNRHLSEVEIDMAKAPLALKQLKKENHANKKRIAEEKLKAAGDTIYSVLKPDEIPEKIMEKKILFIVIICGLGYLLILFTRIHEVINIFGEITESPFFVGLYLLPLIGTPIALVTFYKRENIGWSLLAAIIAFNAAGNLVMWYKIIFTGMSYYYYGNLYRIPVRGADIFYLFILLSIIFVMCKKDMRQLYNIDTPQNGGPVIYGRACKRYYYFGMKIIFW